jgi:hypothetical protein
MLSETSAANERSNSPKRFVIKLSRFGNRTAGHLSSQSTYRAKLLYYSIYEHVETGRPLTECVAAIRHGFKPKYYYILGLDSPERDPSLYVSREKPRYAGEKHKGPFRMANQNAWNVLQDKVAIYSLFDHISDYLPALYGTINDGVYHSRDGGATNSLAEAVDAYDTIAAKPVDREQGKGFYKITAADDGGFRMNSESVSHQDLERFQYNLGFRNYMVTEFIHQHEYSERIFPYTTNTIRVLTVVDPDTGDPHIIRPVHRFGTEKSMPVDNLENGGVLAPIDKESGKIKQFVVFDEDGRRARRDIHPDSNQEVTGTTVPNWEESKSIILEGARSYPMARIIGWDLVITSEKPMILEASGQPGSISPQIEQGLLQDPIARKVLA